MKMLEFLESDTIGRPIAYYPGFRRVCGSITAAIFLCQMIYWYDKSTNVDHWVYKTADEIQSETGMSYEEQRTARKRLIEAGFLEERYARMDHRMYFRIVRNAVNSALEKDYNRYRNNQSSVHEQGNPQFGKLGLPSSLNESETTTETTKEYSASAQISNEPEKTGGDEMQYSDPIWDIAHGKSPAAQDARQARLNQMRNAANRFSPNLQELALAFQEASGGILSAEHLKRDAKALLEMIEAGVTPEIIKDAVSSMQKNGLAVTWPGAATKTAIGIVNIRQARLLAEYEAEAMKEQPAEVTPTPPGQRRRPNIRRWSND